MTNAILGACVLLAAAVALAGGGCSGSARGALPQAKLAARLSG